MNDDKPNIAAEETPNGGYGASLILPGSIELKISINPIEESNK
jgi:hypothetical protein